MPKFDHYGKHIGHEVDANGKPALSKLNEKLLSSLAQELSGIYVRATAGMKDIAQLKAFIEQHERERIDERELQTMQERYPWFAGAAALLLGLQWLL